MTAVFGTPIAAVLLSVELLLFEWKPRSFIPVLVASMAIALGSGTSGGVLAPLLIIGGCVGGLFGRLLPHAAPGDWALIGMAATMGGTMRAPAHGHDVRR
jgi:H+/Cl- antiporter ClcA